MFSRALCAMLAILLYAPLAFSQAAAEYGVGLSKSAGAGAAVGSSIGRAMNRASANLGDSRQTAKPKMTRLDRPRTSRPTLEATMQANRQRLETASGAKAATIQVASVPNKTIVYIDGLAVAYAPSDFCVPAGKHVLELRHPAFLTWRKGLLLAAGESVRLTPKLTQAHDNQVIVSFGN